MLRPARLCIAAVEPERHHGPLAPRGFERSNPRYSGADLAHSPHRPGLDESVLKRDYLLTNQPCEFTVTAVGEVKVFVLHDARWHLATYRDPAKWLAAIRARKGPKSPGSHKHPVAGRKVKDPSRATQLLQLTRLHGWLPRQRIYLLDPQGNCFSVAVPATVAPGGVFKVRAPIRAPYGVAWAARARRTRRARGAHAPVVRAWHSLEVIDEERVPTCLLGGAEGGGGVEGAISSHLDHVRRGRRHAATTQLPTTPHSCFSSQLTLRVCRVDAQVSRQPPPPLPGGYTVGEQVYFTGMSYTFESGDRLEHGKQGEVVGPATTYKGVTVRFPGNKREIQCLLNSVRRRRTRRVFHLGRLKAKK